MAVTQFGAFGLDERLVEALEKQGLIEPTPIQAKAIPILKEGHDVLGIAQTGTGKTAAFVLPILQKLLELKGAPEKKTARALIVVPTRELANQVAESVKKMAEFTRLSCFTVVGGTRADPQIRALTKGLDVLVATPGRLEDHLNAKVFTLSSTVVIALDEADQMLDMGFVPAIRRIMSKMPAKKQAALFSATMPPAIKELASKFMQRPREISVAPANKPIESITQIIYGVAQSRKQSALIQQLSLPEVELALVFVRTKRGADRVQRVLDKAGIASQAIHGDRSQGQRDRALKAFRDGRTKILVATDVAARGIDVPHVSHVFNFDLPQQAESYVHRIGRTGRAGSSGIAITFMNPTEKSTLRDIERITKRKFTVTPLKVEDQTSDINQSVQAEQAAEEEASNQAREARQHSRRGGGRDRSGGESRGRSEGRGEGRSRKPAGPKSQTQPEEQGENRDRQRRQAQNEDDFEKRAKGKQRPGQRARRRDRAEMEGDDQRPHRAVQRDADSAWEASFDADVTSADGVDSNRKPQKRSKPNAKPKARSSSDSPSGNSGKAKPKPPAAGKANKPNSKKGAVAKASDQKRRTRAKAAKRPEAKPRGFIKK